MKRITLVFLVALFALSATAQTPAASPTNTNNVFWTMRVTVKMDKKLEWEKKIVLFMKAHHPDLKYRVYEVLTGENSGSYVMAVGPMNYKDLDAVNPSPKGAAARQTDVQALDALCISTVVAHGRRQDDMSTIKADRKLKYVVVTTIQVEPGTWTDVRALIMKNNEARKKGESKIDVDYFRPSVSGAPNSYISVRHVEKLEDLDTQEDLNAMVDNLYGNNTFVKDMEAFYSNVVTSTQELRVVRPDLSAL